VIAAIVALAIALASVAVTSVISAAVQAAAQRNTMAMADEAKDATRAAQSEAVNFRLAADTADALRKSSEDRVRRLESALRQSTERFADALQSPVSFHDRASAIEYANRLLSRPEAAAADTADPGATRSGPAVPEQPANRTARDTVPGVQVR
jgi:hypothetical protein